MKKLLIVIGLLFLCSKSYGLTRGDAETEIRYLIKDSNSSLQRYTDTVLDSFINTAQREIVSETWCLETTTGIALVSQTTYYNLPSDLIAVKLVRFKPATNQTRNLPEVSFKSIQESNPDYERQTGPPMQYFIRDSTFSAVVQIAGLPIATTSSTGTMTIDYYKQATDISSDSTVLFDGQVNLIPYHETVVYKVAAKIKMIQNDLPTANAYFQLYGSMISTLVSKSNQKPNYNPSLSAATSTSSSSIGR